MSDENPLGTSRANQTLAFAGLAVGIVVSLVGGPFELLVGLTIAGLSCAAIASLHWAELLLLFTQGRLNRHLLLPAVLVVMTMLVAGMATWRVLHPPPEGWQSVLSYLKSHETKRSPDLPASFPPSATLVPPAAPLSPLTQQPPAPVFIDCKLAPVPPAYPQSGIVNSLGVIRRPRGVTNELNGAPGTEVVDGLQTHPPAFPWACEISQYSETPLLNLRLPLKLDFYPAEKIVKPYGYDIKASPKKYSATWSINLGRLASGIGGAQMLYIRNFTTDNVAFSFGKHSNGTLGSAPGQKQIPVVTATHYPIQQVLDADLAK